MVFGAHPGMLFGFPSEGAFSFTGIPSFPEDSNDPERSALSNRSEPEFSIESLE